MTQTTISLGFHTALLEDQVGELSEALSKLDFADEIVGELGCLSANVLLSEWRSTVGADGIANVVTTLGLVRVLTTLCPHFGQAKGTRFFIVLQCLPGKMLHHPGS